MQAVTTTQIASGHVVKVSTCRSCGARVIWTVTENGKRMPVDEAPAQGGRFVLELDGETVVARYAAPPNGAGYASHFSTCPNAGAWRS